MTELLLHGKTVPTAFHLLGKRENDLTYSRGWALAQSPAFLSSFINATLRIRPNLDNVMLRLQQREGTQGITDIEIESSGEFFLVVEANRGWTLPSRAQLETQLTLSSGASGEFPRDTLRSTRSSFLGALVFSGLRLFSAMTFQNALPSTLKA